MKLVKPDIVNWLLTRKCNLKCGFCNIVKDYTNMPYPEVGSYKELSLEENKEIVDAVLKANPHAFFILYGGEPTLYKHIKGLVDYLNEKDANYTIISNMTGKHVNDTVDDLLENHNLKGLSFSLDPICFQKSLKNLDMDRYTKSIEAINRIKSIKEKYPEVDVVAEITVDRLNVHYLERLLMYLTEADIYSSITTIEYGKNRYYDFAPETTTDLVITKDMYEYKIFTEVYNNIWKYKVHFPETLKILLEKLPMQFNCSLDSFRKNMTIEPDGTLRLCLRIKGNFHKHPKGFKAVDVLGNEYHSRLFLDSCATDWNTLCQGCAWTCVMMTKLTNDGFDISKITH